jgi:5'-nucleotidase
VTTEYCWEAFLGALKVTFDAAGKVTAYQGDPIYLANTIVKDPAVVAMMAPYDQQVNQLRSQAIGSTTVDLPVFVGSQQVCRVGECLIGDLVMDSVMWKLNVDMPARGLLLRGEAEDPYQIGLLNGGSFRAPLTGTISVGDVMEVLPFGNTIATFEITGTQLLQALESGVSMVGGTSNTGRFPQVAGMRYTFNSLLPPGSRLVSAEVLSGTQYVPLDPLKIYRVATNDYVRTGGDGYTVFANYAIDPYDFGPPLDETLSDYIQMLGVVDSTDIMTGRIFIQSRYFFPLVAGHPAP